jgi:hypothetical protein
MAGRGPVRDLDDLIDRVYQQPSLPLGLRRDLQAALLELRDLRQRMPREHLALIADAELLARALARNGDTRAGRRICRAQFGWSRGAWYRRLHLARAQRAIREGALGQQPSGATPMPPRIVKTVPLQNATAPPEIKLTGKPPIPPELSTAPRASGAAATGETDGNYEQPDVAIGAGTGPQVGVNK